MSETKHTPLPWFKEGRSIYALDALPHRWRNGEPVMANRFYCHVESQNGLCSQEEVEANVNLLFAAPDLLAALKAISDFLAYGIAKPEGAEPNADDHAEAERLGELAGAAIAKAEGRS